MFAVRCLTEGGSRRGGQGKTWPFGAWLLVESVVPPIAANRWTELVCVPDVQSSEDARLIGFPVKESEK